MNNLELTSIPDPIPTGSPTRHRGHATVRWGKIANRVFVAAAFAVMGAALFATSTMTSTPSTASLIPETPKWVFAGAALICLLFCVAAHSTLRVLESPTKLVKPHRHTRVDGKCASD